MDSRITPTTGKKRLEWIDAARGFAIFGIFMVNIGAFSAPYFIHGGQDVYWSSTIDQWTLAIIDIFFQASFYSLFSILFGFGMQMMVDKLQRQSQKPEPFLLRRLLFLLLFGILHAWLIWHGDILITYAITGMIFIFFLQASTKKLTIAGTIFLLGSVGLLTLPLYLLRDQLGGYSVLAVERAVESYQSSKPLVIWQQNFQDWMYTNNPTSFVFLLFILLSLFILGMVLARKRWYHEPDKYQGELRMIWGLSLAGFLLLKAVPYLFGNPAWFSTIQDNLGGPSSAVFYLTTITILMSNGQLRWLTRAFANVGRMAFSNYILQSIVSVWIFYGIGLGLYGRVSPLQGLLIAMLIFMLQVMASHQWLKHFRFGPLEWLWRSLMYGEVQQLKKER